MRDDKDADHMTDLVSRTVAFIGALSVLLCSAGCPSAPPPDLEPQPEGPGVHWLRFAQISDAQAADEESPARSVRGDRVITNSWRPQEGYVLQTLDATVRVLKERHANPANPPVDFVVFTGDLADSAQENELRWVIDTMDGRLVTHDSGELDGALRKVPPEGNPKLMFQAEGVGSIPWYSVFGNHDFHASGVFPIDRNSLDSATWFAPLFGTIASLLGYMDLRPPLGVLFPTGAQSPAIIEARNEQIDPETLQLRMEDLFAGPIVQDSDRRYTSRISFMEAHFDTDTLPVGHGFTQANLDSGDARYSVRPKAEVPVRLLVIDTVAPGSTFKLPYHFGTMTREQFEGFVKPEVEAAHAAEEFVLIASHHPSEDFDIPHPEDAISTQEWRAYLAGQPNIIAHVAGHTHRHRVRRIDGRYPYLEIETASIIDYPQEGRILDLFFIEETNSIRIESTTFSHMENPTALSAESFRRAAVDVEFAGMYGLPDGLDTLFPEVIYRDKAGASAVEDWVSQQAISSDERYGSETDREFSFTFAKP
jgi:3',5'-cyclic AMP phosphodiesterase CpdA